MRALTLLAILAFVCGCGTQRGGNVAPAETTGEASFTGRLEAAKAIVHATERDTSLSSLAVEAAKNGEGQVAKECVHEIVNATVKDDAGYNAAVALAQRGRAEDAKAVADLIVHASMPLARIKRWRRLLVAASKLPKSRQPRNPNCTTTNDSVVVQFLSRHSGGAFSCAGG